MTVSSGFDAEVTELVIGTRLLADDSTGAEAPVFLVVPGLFVVPVGLTDEIFDSSELPVFDVRTGTTPPVGATMVSGLTMVLEDSGAVPAYGVVAGEGPTDVVFGSSELPGLDVTTGTTPPVGATMVSGLTMVLLGSGDVPTIGVVGGDMVLPEWAVSLREAGDGLVTTGFRGLEIGASADEGVTTGVTPVPGKSEMPRRDVVMDAGTLPVSVMPPLEGKRVVENDLGGEYVSPLGAVGVMLSAPVAVGFLLVVIGSLGPVLELGRELELGATMPVGAMTMPTSEVDEVEPSCGLGSDLDFGLDEVLASLLVTTTVGEALVSWSTGGETRDTVVSPY